MGKVFKDKRGYPVTVGDAVAVEGATLTKHIREMVKVVDLKAYETDTAKVLTLPIVKASLFVYDGKRVSHFRVCKYTDAASVTKWHLLCHLEGEDVYLDFDASAEHTDTTGGYKYAAKYTSATCPDWIKMQFSELIGTDQIQDYAVTFDKTESDMQEILNMCAMLIEVKEKGMYFVDGDLNVGMAVENPQCYGMGLANEE